MNQSKDSPSDKQRNPIDTDHDTDDSADHDADDDDDDDGGDDGHSADGADRADGADDTRSDGAHANRGEDSAVKVSCTICGYEWRPKRKPREIRQCLRRNSRKWKGNSTI